MSYAAASLMFDSEWYELALRMWVHWVHWKKIMFSEFNIKSTEHFLKKKKKSVYLKFSLRYLLFVGRSILEKVICSSFKLNSMCAQMSNSDKTKSDWRIKAGLGHNKWPEVSVKIKNNQKINLSTHIHHAFNTALKTNLYRQYCNNWFQILSLS